MTEVTNTEVAVETVEATEVVIGVKETKEAINGLFALTIFLAERLKDGVGADDAVALFAKLQGDEEFKAVLAEAIKGRELIKAELKDVKLLEGVELVKQVIDFVPQLVDALKK